MITMEILYYTIAVYLFVLLMFNMISEFSIFERSLVSLRSLHKIPRDVWDSYHSLRVIFRIIIVSIIVILSITWKIFLSILTGSVFVLILFKQK